VRLDDRRVDLTPTEFAILLVLARHPGVVYSRLQLLEAVQGESYEGYERAIDSHIKNLRQKLEVDPKNPRYVTTVHGVGYRLEAPHAS
jgi:DNA-binding response OmpR family regulator